MIDLIRLRRVFSLNGSGKKPTRLDHEGVSGSLMSLEAIGLTVIAGLMGELGVRDSYEKTLF